MLKGVHFLLNYKCDLECDHCFVWGKPTAKSVFRFEQVKQVLGEAQRLGTVTYVSVEGEEPFLHYPIMVRTVQEAVRLGFHVEVLTNCYWATCQEDAEKWLAPLAEAENVELSLSSDLYHGDRWITSEVKNAVKAANKLGLKVGIIAIKNPTDTAAQRRSKVQEWISVNSCTKAEQPSSSQRLPSRSLGSNLQNVPTKTFLIHKGFM